MATIRNLQANLFDKINPAVKFSVTRFVMAVGFFIAVFGFGFISTVFHLGVDLLPSINIPMVVVQTNYAGANPKVMDQQVTQVIERAVSTVQGITDINSNSSTGSSFVRLSFDMSIDKNAAANQVAAKVSQAARSLPANLTVPPAVVTFDLNSAPIIQFGISAEGVTLNDIGSWVTNNLALQLDRLDGVANVTVDGAPTREFNVLLNPNKLASFGILPQAVTSAIAGNAITQPIGSIVTAKSTITFSTNNLPDNAEKIANILVDPTRGITVGAVATIQDNLSPGNYDRVNGVPSVVVSVIKTSEGNAVAVAKSIREFLDKTTLPAGFKLTYSNDSTGPIRASIDATKDEILLTALIVAIICLLFLGKLNTALSVILAIPIALSAAPILYNLCGFSFNLVSLQAMIVAIGIVVDDSIVVSENVERYRHMGFNLMDSVLKGASEVFSAVLAASLSLLAVLLPVSFLGGIIGQYIAQFSLGLAAAVFFSLLEAILFLTVRLAYTPEAHTFDWNDFFRSWVELPQAFKWSFKNWKKGIYVAFGIAALAISYFVGKSLNPEHGWMAIFAILPFWPVTLGILLYVLKIAVTGLQALTTPLHNLTERFVEWVREGYVKYLGPVLNQAVWVLVGAGVVFLGTIVFMFGTKAGSIPFTFVPSYDSGTITVNSFLPHNTPPSISNELSGKIESWLRNQPEVSTSQVIVQTGWGSGGGGRIQITVTLIPIEKRKNSSVLTTEWRRALMPVVQSVIPSGRLSVSAGGSFGGGGASSASLSVSLTSVDYNLLVATNNKVIAALNANPQVADVNSSLTNTTVEDFYPDPQKLQGTGLSPATTAVALQTYASGVQAANAEINGLAYPINVQLDPSFLHGTQSLLDLPIYSQALGTSLRVGQLGRFSMTPAPSTITRYNRLYSAQLDINLNPNAPAILTFKNELIGDLTEAGILNGQITMGDTSKTGATALASQMGSTLPAAFFLAMFLVYLVMGAQFNSWKYPLYLLLPVPLALVGALWLIYFVGTGLDVFGTLGMLMLIGLSAKNAIIYLDFVVERLETMPLREALLDSARLRFRPIVMTTLTVLVISFPLIFSTGQGSEFGRTLGIVMMGGIFASAVLTFFVVPAAFWLFERKKYQNKNLLITEQ